MQSTWIARMLHHQNRSQRFGCALARHGSTQTFAKQHHHFLAGLVGDHQQQVRITECALRSFPGLGFFSLKAHMATCGAVASSARMSSLWPDRSGFCSPGLSGPFLRGFAASPARGGRDVFGHAHIAASLHGSLGDRDENRARAERSRPGFNRPKTGGAPLASPVINPNSCGTTSAAPGRCEGRGSGCGLHLTPACGIMVGSLWRWVQPGVTQIPKVAVGGGYMY
jgi:hypothetical protein